MKPVVISFFLLLTTGLYAQSGKFLTAKDADPKAKSLLKQVKDQLNLEKGTEIDFEFKYFPSEGAATTQKGKLDIKGKKFKLDINDQQLTSDGVTFWTFLKKRNEVQIQDAKAIEDDPMSPFRLLQIHDSPDFTYILASPVKENNVSFEIIEFKPLDTKADFFKIKAQIDKAKKQYRKIVLYLKNGDQYALEIKNQISKTFSDTWFVWDVNSHKNVSVEDLR